MISIDHFEPSEAEPHRAWLFIGARGTGKSKCIRSVIYDMKKKLDAVFLISPTKETQDEFAEFTARCFIFEKVSVDIISKISLMGQQLMEQGRDRNFLVVIDDCAYDKSLVKNQAFILELFNGRHHNVALFYSSQYMMFVPPFMRDNVDYIFVGYDMNKKNKNKLFEAFFGMFDSIKDFNIVMNECTQDYGFLVRDRITKGKTINDNVKMYKGRIDLPPFRVGPKIYFELTNKYRIGAASKKDIEEVVSNGIIPLNSTTRITGVKTTKRKANLNGSPKRQSPRGKRARV